MEVTPTRGLTSSRKKAQKPPGSNGKGAADGVSARKRQRAEGEDPVEECDFLQEDASDDDEVQASDTDKPRSAVKDALAKALAAHTRLGRVATTGRVTAFAAASPGLHIKGVGTVTLPLTAGQASEIKAKASPDPGLGALAWRVDASLTSFVNPGWATAIACAKDEACAALGLGDAENINAEVSHLLLWEPTTAKATGTVTAEGLLASEPAPGCEHAGVLIVSLPGSFSGGSLAAAAEGGRQWAAPAGKNMGIEPSFFAMHAGSALRPQPLTAGHRLDVVFALARPKRPGRPSASSLSSASTALTAASDAAAPSPYAEALEATRAALAAWAANDQAPPALVFLLSNTYEREAMEQAAAEAAERGCAAGVPGLLEDGDFALAEALAEALRRGGSGAGEGEAWASRADAFVASCTVTTSGLGRGASASGRAKAAPDGSLPPSKHRRPSLESPTAAGTASASASAHPADHHHHAEEEESPFDGDVTTSVEIADLLALCSESIWPPPHARARLHLELAEDGAVAGAPSPGRASGLVDVPSAVVLNLPEEGLKPNSREEPGFGELRLIARRSAVVLWRHECAAQLLCREPAAAAERVGALVSAGAAGCSGGAAPLSAAATALTAGLLVQLALYAVNSGHCLTSTSSAAVRSAVEAALARAAEGGASGAAGPTAPAVAALGEAAARELLKLRAEDIYGDDFEPSDFADTAVQRGEVLAAFGALMPSCGAFAPVCAAAAGAVAARGTLLEAAQLLEGADRAGGGGGGGARFRACAAALSRVAAEQRKSLLRRCSGDEAAFALAKIVPLLRLRAPDLLESTLGALLFLHKRLPVSALPASASAAAFAAADDLLVPAALLSVAPEELCAAAVASASDPRLRGAPPEEREGDVLARCLATLREQQLTRQERPPGAGCSAAAAAVAALAPGPLGQRRSLIFDCEEWTPAAIPDWSLPLAFCPTGRRCPVCHGLVAFLEDSTCREATLEDLKTSHVRHVRRVLRAVVPGLAVVAESTTATSAAAQAAATPPPALKAAGRAAAAWRVRVRKLRPRNWAELEQEGVMISRADVFQELLLVLGKMQPPGPGGA